MIQTIVTAFILFILRQRVDLLVILLIFLLEQRTKKEYRDIYIGSVANLKII
jgi:cadmium resistance protein CadD (predicted permease)